MNIFGVGPMELLLVLILALIFLGPEELPTVARTLGKLVRDLQKLSADFTEQVKTELGPELEELNKATRELQEVSDKVQKAQAVVRHPTQAVEQEVRKALSPTSADEPPAEKDKAEQRADASALSPISQRPLSPEPSPSAQDDAEEATGVEE